VGVEKNSRGNAIANPAVNAPLTEKLLAELEDKAGKKRLLLMIDEVQHLSTSRSFDPLTHALRTMLDKRQGRVKSIFTGSSRHYMNLLLNESQSPFITLLTRCPSLILVSLLSSSSG
jgi:hypothetical protein